jgi:hypothetical protein
MIASEIVLGEFPPKTPRAGMAGAMDQGHSSEWSELRQTSSDKA